MFRLNIFNIELLASSYWEMDKSGTQTLNISELSSHITSYYVRNNDELFLHKDELWLLKILI